MMAEPTAPADRQWLATVFAGNPGSGRPPARGNTAAITQLPRHRLDDTAHLQARANGADAATSCFFATSGSSLQIPVRCFNRTHAIQCCGHGLYAVAGILHNVLAADTASVALRTAGGAITARFGAQDVAIALPLIDCMQSQVPAWASVAAGIAPVAVAHAGREDGYALWVYSSVDQVIGLQLAEECLTANTRRAIIATSWDTTSPSGFVLRYFAPQYGVPEDPVTGSAMRIAGEYWRRHSGNTAFQVWQCSAAGGVARLTLDQKNCWLEGSHASKSVPVAG